MQYYSLKGMDVTIKMMKMEICEDTNTKRAIVMCYVVTDSLQVSAIDINIISLIITIILIIVTRTVNPIKT